MSGRRLDVLGLADAADSAFLDRPEQLDLERLGTSVISSRKRVPASAAEKAQLVRDRPREGPLTCLRFRLDSVSGMAPAVDRDESLSRRLIC